MNATATVASKHATLDRHIEWLKKHHHQSGGAARNLRTSIGDTVDAFVADQKRKAADAAAINAAHYHEIAEMLEKIISARKTLRAFEGHHASYARFVEAVDRALGL